MQRVLRIVRVGTVHLRLYEVEEFIRGCGVRRGVADYVAERGEDFGQWEGVRGWSGEEFPRFRGDQGTRRGVECAFPAFRRRLGVCHTWRIEREPEVDRGAEIGRRGERLFSFRWGGKTEDGDATEFVFEVRRQQIRQQPLHPESAPAFPPKFLCNSHGP